MRNLGRDTATDKETRPRSEAGRQREKHEAQRQTEAVEAEKSD